MMMSDFRYQEALMMIMRMIMMIALKLTAQRRSAACSVGSAGFLRLLWLLATGSPCGGGGGGCGGEMTAQTSAVCFRSCASLRSGAVLAQCACG